MITSRCLLKHAALAAWLGTAPSMASAALVVDWGGNYVATTQSSQRSADTAFTQPNPAWAFNHANSSARGMPFSAATPLNPTVGSAYGASTGLSPVFYGGLSGGRLSNGGTSWTFDVVSLTVVESGDNDVLAFGLQHNNSSQNRASTGMALWKSENYLGPAAGQTFSLSDATVRLNITASGTHNTQLRLLVRDESTYYYSDLVAGFSPSVGLQTLTSTALQTLQFSAITLTDGSYSRNNLNQGSATKVSGSTLTKINSIGFTFNTGSESASLRGNLQVDSFEVDVVPEPSSLLAAVAAASVLMRRRR